MNLPQFYIDDLIKTALKEDINYIDVTTDYLLDPEHEIHARYMMTGAGSELEQRLLAEGWTLLFQGRYATVYERP